MKTENLYAKSYGHIFVSCRKIAPVSSLKGAKKKSKIAVLWDNIFQTEMYKQK